VCVCVVCLCVYVVCVCVWCVCVCGVWCVRACGVYFCGVCVWFVCMGVCGVCVCVICVCVCVCECGLCGVCVCECGVHISEQVDARGGHVEEHVNSKNTVLGLLHPMGMFIVESTAVRQELPCLPCRCPSDIPIITVFTTDCSGSPSLPPL